MSTEASTSVKPAVPEPPKLERAYKDQLILTLPEIPADCTVAVEHAATPAYVYYTWTKIADDAVTGTRAVVSGLTPERSFITRITVKNAAGTATSGYSDIFSTLSETADAAQRLAEATADAVKYKADCERLAEEIAATRGRIASLEVAASGSDSAKSQRIGALEDELRSTRAQLAEALTTIETQKRERKALSAQLDSTSQLHADVDSLRRENAALRKELATSQTDTKTATDKAHALQNEVSTLQAQSEALVSEVQAMRGMLSELTQQTSSLMTDLTTSQSALAQLTQESIDVKAALTDARARESSSATAANDRTAHLTSEVEALRGQVATLTSQAEARSASHAQELAAATAGHGDAMKVLSDKVATLREAKEAAVADLEAARTGIRMVQDAAKLASDNHADKVTKLETALGLARQETATIRSEMLGSIDASATKEATLNQALAAAQRSLEIERAQTVSMTRRVTELEGAMAALESRARAAEDAKIRLESELAGARGETMALKEACGGHSTELARVKTALAAAQSLQAQTTGDLVLNLSKLEAANSALMKRNSELEALIVEARASQSRSDAQVWELRSALEAVEGATGGDKTTVDTLRSDLNTLYLEPDFVSGGIARDQLPAAFAAYWKLREMGFGGEAARAAVRTHPRDESARVAACLGAAH